MRTGTIDNHDDEFGRMGLADLNKELVHLPGVHLRTNHPVQFSLDGTDGSVNIGELPLVAVVDAGT